MKPVVLMDIIWGTLYQEYGFLVVLFRGFDWAPNSPWLRVWYVWMHVHVICAKMSWSLNFVTVKWLQWISLVLKHCMILCCVWKQTNCLYCMLGFCLHSPYSTRNFSMQAKSGISQSFYVTVHFPHKGVVDWFEVTFCKFSTNIISWTTGVDSSLGPRSRATPV